jgi:hypothetical protein
MKLGNISYILQTDATIINLIHLHFTDGLANAVTYREIPQNYVMKKGTIEDTASAR